MNISENKNFLKFMQMIMQYDFQEKEIIAEITSREANERYYISNYGNAFSLCGKQWLQLSPSPDSKGYLEITIRYNDEEGNEIKQHCRIHQLVAEIFVPNEDPDKKTIVHHRDGNRLNNHYSNLIWVDEAEHGKLHAELNTQRKKQAIAENGL